MPADWTKILLIGGGAAGVAAVLYYLLREEQHQVARPERELAVEAPSKKGAISKEQVRQILQDIISAQELMRGYMKDLTRESRNKAMTFQEIYQRIKSVQPSDPLEDHGLTMADFDALLETHQTDQVVREAITKIMGAPSPGSQESQQVKDISVAKIIDVHRFMQKELNNLVEEFLALPSRESFDMKTVAIAAQAMVGARVEQEFGYSSEDIEGAVLQKHSALAEDRKFGAINHEIQQAMAKLMGDGLSGNRPP
jgi:hypothetical protein